jgi:hypothetical protein
LIEGRFEGGFGASVDHAIGVERLDESQDSQEAQAPIRGPAWMNWPCAPASEESRVLGHRSVHGGAGGGFHGRGPLGEIVPRI